MPCQETQQFYTIVDGQTEVEITITQGEDTDPDYVNKIATEVFRLPPNRPANRPIKVTYSYDLNQRMHCRFEDEDSGRVLEVDFCVGENGEMSQANVTEKCVSSKASKSSNVAWKGCLWLSTSSFPSLRRSGSYWHVRCSTTVARFGMRCAIAWRPPAPDRPPRRTACATARCFTVPGFQLPDGFDLCPGRR